ncbi:MULTISPECIES: succinylglutamate desuccinylase/aspartoacylase family protein [unclassified Hydrogenophaga]|uniref:succinylglutamate desuccinylase/aspartoacylase family protein n=1 Tax=unclassified Hydrogenophaga TaxID=2610897 RepID=UPI00087871EE|nr:MULTISPECIES: succinylglutamate desuccinylase/aspartoacylase family protein [unclassified Hydrogenophaga]MBN9371178.1 succinylglutamate desuccinylase/aspartoacylase family protein [Hydrogenophaga sp.]OJV69051.1 MAG: succinylglutamate desuccinylase [Hydrogenophaga sp. 70-12]
MERTEHPLLSPSLGHQKHLVSFRYGAEDARPKVYLQASLHAEELPGMLVAHHLRPQLEAAEREGRLRGQVVLVPAANPIGLTQRLNHRAMGRFEFGTSQNFNRHYPNLADALFDELRDRLGPDPQANVALVRAAATRWLRDWRPATELDSLRRQLFLLAHDADVVLDLHCDWEAALHLYAEEACWAPLAPLAWLLGCRAVLLARDSGGEPFDETLSGLWWRLAERLRAQGIHHPLPQACASATVELRGEADVSHDNARIDAKALMDYLLHLRVLDGPAPAIPRPSCEATPLAGSQTLHSPVAGVVAFCVRPGDTLAVGEVVAEVIDPTAPGASRVHRITAGVAGVLYAAIGERYVVAGGEIGKIAGATPFRTGHLLGA